MAVVLEEQVSPAAKFDNQVDEQIAQATSRIRVHDLTFGALSLAALLSSYAAIMILLDKYCHIPEGLRQLSLFAFGGVFLGAVFWLIVRPLRNRINPLYAAVCVEKTIDDAKNSVTGYVAAQEKGDVHATIKAAMSARAARAVSDADVNRAIDHRSLLVVGGTFLFFMFALIAMFFVFHPTQFNSLLSRSFMPFSARPIESRTQLTLLKPDPAEPTLTTGQTISVAVYVGGKVPAKDSPDRVRVLIRHNQADPDYEEIPLHEGETSRDWQVTIPNDLVLNGFWYKVVAGDSETPEYRVTVRSLPLFTGFEATYVYPTYTRKPSDKSFSADIRAIPGTHVTLIAKTNRDVKDGSMKLPSGGIVEGVRVPHQPDSLKFEFEVKEATKYSLFLTTQSGEKNSNPPAFTISIDADLPPTVQITKPEDAEITTPANGQLTVDGTVGDDFGINKVRLRLRVADQGRDLSPLPYLGGQSFYRAKDDSWPRNLDYKDSADLTKLKFTDGTAFQPKEGMVIEYWVEAIDNCTQTQPAADWENLTGNVGRSTVQRVRLTAPKTDMEKQQLDQSKAKRKNEEQRHNQQQQQKLDTENRDQQPQEGEPKKSETQPNGKPNQDADANTPKQEKQEPQAGKNDKGMGMGEPMPNSPDQKTPENKNSDPQNPQNGQPSNTNQKNTPSQSPDQKNPENKNSDPQNPQNGQPSNTNQKNTPSQSPNEPKSMPPAGMDQTGMPEPSTPPKPADPKGADTPSTKPDMNNPGVGGMDNNANPKQPAPMPQSTPEDKKAEEQARQVQQELEKTQRPEGDAKPNPAAKPEDRREPAAAKPKPSPTDGSSPDAPAKEEPKSTEPMANPMTNPMANPMTNPMAGEKSAPSASKPEGNLEKPTAPAEPKPAPAPSDAKEGNEKNAQPAETRDEPLGGSPGQEKPEPKAKAEPKTNSQGKANDKSSPDEPKNQQDATSGASAKPATERKEDADGKNQEGGKTDPEKKPLPDKKPQNDPAKNAGQAKPMNEPSRGQDKKPDEPKSGAGEPSEDEHSAASPKPQTPPESGASKPKKSAPMTNKEKEPEASEPKPSPADANPNDPMNGAAKTKAEQSKETQEPKDPKEPTSGGEKTTPDKSVEKGIDKDPQSGTPSSKPKTGQKEPGAGNNPDAPKDGSDQNSQKLDPKKLEELKNAARDLNSDDAQKRQQAQKKLDDNIGEANRKKLEDDLKKERAKSEQLQKDLQSSDKATREAAEKKVEEMLNKAAEQAKNEGQGQGKEPSPEQVADLVKKAKDLNSPDDAKRQAAEKALDEKLGKEAREKLQDELKNKQAETAEQQRELEKKVEEQAKEAARSMGPVDPNRPRRPPGPAADKPKPALEDDPRSRAKTAELQLEEFEKNRYNKDLQDRLGWTAKEYEDFLKAQQKRVEQLQKEATLTEQTQKPVVPSTGPASINANGGTKVEERGNGTKGTAKGTGAVFAPPGFEDAKKQFERAVQKLPPKQ
jgi:hypothetical protein